MGVPAGPWYIDDLMTFTVVTHRFDTGALTDADAVPAYRIYEDETGTAILTGNTAKLDDSNTTGFYSEQITLSAANGFEVGKSYSIYVSAAVNSVTGGQTFNFKVINEPLRPTTAGRTLDVTATGAAGIDWGNVENLTTANDLSNTTIKTTQKVDVDTIKTQSVTLSGGVTIPAATLASTTNITAGTITTVTNLTNAPTNGDLTTAMKASVNAEVDTALADINLDHLVKIAVDTDFATTVHLNSVIGQLADNGTSATFDRTTDSLEAIRDRGDASWITATGFSTHSAADVWAVGTRLLTAGTNIVLAKGTGITGFNDLSAAQVNAEVDTALADYDGPTHAELTAELATADDAVLAAIAGLNNISTAQVNAEVDTALADVGLTTTVTGRIDVAVSSRLASGNYTAPDNASITAIKNKTDSLTFTNAGEVDANVQSVNDVELTGTGVETTDEWRPA